MVKRPIDSFKQYFLDIKPYHTKILEIIEQYKFQEDVNVTIQESLLFQESFEPDVLCHGVGYGLDFDDECGLDSDSCCDLFEACLGGYGLIYDNNDLLLTAPVDSVDAEGHTITLTGDYRYDTFLQISDTVGTSRIKLKGNVVATLAPHYLFVVIKKNRYDVSETKYNGFYFNGNVESQFLLKNQFTVFNSGSNDDAYSVVSAVYNSTEDRTFVTVHITEDLDTTSLGYVLINSDSKNNGVYQRTDVYFDGTDTNIVLHEDTQLKLAGETEHGVVTLRTALKAPRHIFFDATDDEWRIVDSSYDLVTNTTTLTIETSSDLDGPSSTVSLRGYFSSAGFDGLEECTTPKPNHLYASFSEFVEFTVNFDVPVVDEVFFALLTDTMYEDELDSGQS